VNGEPYDIETARLLAEAHKINEGASLPPALSNFLSAQMRRRLQREEELVKLYALPLLKKGYRFGELVQHKQRNGATGGYDLLSVGVGKPRHRLTLWLRRKWRRWFPYGCQGVKIGGKTK
jgi:hypothetical protein